MRQDISVVRGTNNVFGLVVTNADGSPFKIADNQVLVFGVKKDCNNAKCILLKKILHTVEEGTYYLEIVPSDTCELDTGRYFYDVGLQEGENTYFSVIETSVFEIKPNVTELGVTK